MLEDLGTKSVPRNPLQFSTLYRMRLVEQIGSSIRRICDAYEEYKVAESRIFTPWRVGSRSHFCTIGIRHPT